MTILEKIKKYGIVGSVKVAERRFTRSLNKIIFYFCWMFPIDQHLIVMESEGDLSDNAFALYNYMLQNQYLKTYKVVWLVDDVDKAKTRDFPNTDFVEKYPKKVTRKRSKALATCKFYIYDHCNMMNRLKKRSGQKIIYLGHGAGVFKAPKGGSLKNRGKIIDEVYTIGEISKKSVYDWQGVNEEKTYILGFSRLDWFYTDLSGVKKKINEEYSVESYKKTILWMPTFRKCDNEEISENYLDSGTGLPLLNSKEKLNDFDKFLLKNNILVFLKLHHLQSDMPVFKQKFSNIKIVRDEELADNGIQLYQFIPHTDALVTDYSSISADYMLLNKPMIYILDDYDEYRKSRGIYSENVLELMPGYHVFNLEELKEAIIEICRGVDKYKNKRNELLPKFHTYQDGCASKRILDHLGIMR